MLVEVVPSCEFEIYLNPQLKVVVFVPKIKVVVSYDK